MSEPIENLMDGTSYGRAAFKKFGAVANDFHIFSAAWIGDKPENWKSMRVKGARWKGNNRIPGTTMETIVTKEEMDEVAKATGEQP